MNTTTFVAALSFPDESGVRTLPLAGEAVTLGRSPRQDVVRSEPFVSRKHAVIARCAEGFEVIDQESTHGTFVNGALVERAILHPGDIVQLGSLQAPALRFVLQRAGESERPQRTSMDTLLETLSGFPAPAGPVQATGAREIEQLNFLLEAARALNAGEATQDILRALLHLSIRLTGVERGFVFLCDGSELRVALGMDASGQALSEDSTVSRRAIQKAITSQANFSIDDTLSDSVAAAWSSVILHHIRSIYCIPLRKRQETDDAARLLGLLYLDNQLGPGHLTEVDHQMLNAIATEAASLLHNALLAEAEFKARQAQKELAIAAQIHAGLMSIALPMLPFARIRGRSLPCLAIGGDFYDAVALEGDCLGAVIADISGKGVSSAIVAATLQGIIHALMLAGRELAEIAAVVNQFLCTRQVGKYATLVMLKLHADGRLEYVNCGHIQPALVRAGGVERLEEGNLVVGLIQSAEYVSATCTLQQGDRLLLTTDGITEAENADGEAFGNEGVYSVAGESSLDAMLNRVATFMGPCEAQDDCTLLEICYTGGGAG